MASNAIAAKAAQGAAGRKSGSRSSAEIPTQVVATGTVGTKMDAHVGVMAGSEACLGDSKLSIGNATQITPEEWQAELEKMSASGTASAIVLLPWESTTPVTVTTTVDVEAGLEVAANAGVQSVVVLTGNKE